jgi:hypothetical protein
VYPQIDHGVTVDPLNVHQLANPFLCVDDRTLMYLLVPPFQSWQSAVSIENCNMPMPLFRSNSMLESVENEDHIIIVLCGSCSLAVTIDRMPRR